MSLRYFDQLISWLHSLSIYFIYRTLHLQTFHDSTLHVRIHLFKLDQPLHKSNPRQKYFKMIGPFIHIFILPRADFHGPGVVFHRFHFYDWTLHSCFHVPSNKLSWTKGTSSHNWFLWLGTSVHIFDRLRVASSNSNTVLSWVNEGPLTKYSQGSFCIDHGIA